MTGAAGPTETTGVLELTAHGDASMEASIWIEGVMRATEAPADLIDRVTLAVAEVVANAVEHGRPPIQVRAAGVSGAWSVTVQEGGRGPSREALEAAALPGDATSTHGRGLYLIVTLSDDVHVDAGRVRLTFRSRPP